VIDCIGIADGGETVILLKTIVSAIKKLSLAQDPTPTPSSLANTLVANLGENDRGVDGKGSTDTILSIAQADELKEITSERRCVHFMTPVLRDIFKDAVVVNSEEFPWLRTQGQPQKPDLFISHRWAYTSRTLSDNMVERGQSDPAFRFGALYDTRLYDSVYLLDCKLTCTNEALGELIIHLQHQSHQLPAHSVVRGMLFGKYQFMLVKVQGQELTERITGTWTEPGSKACIVEFFPALPWCGVDEICSNVSVEVDESSTDHSTAFLGAGSFGRVLKVHRRVKDGCVEGVLERLALKVSLLGDIARLETEHSVLANHKKDCGCSLIVHPESEFLHTAHLCGYLMSPVGVKPLQRNSLSNKHLKLAVRALHGLHSHNPIVIHGDPRLPNLILQLDETVVWVDLFKSHWKIGGAFSIASDIGILIESVLGEFNANTTPCYNDLQSCRTVCSKNVTLPNYDALYDVLVAARK
jgi:hypothetical protein